MAQKGENLLFCYLLRPAEGIGFIFVGTTDGAKQRKKKKIGNRTSVADVTALIG